MAKQNIYFEIFLAEVIRERDGLFENLVFNHIPQNHDSLGVGFNSFGNFVPFTWGNDAILDSTIFLQMGSSTNHQLVTGSFGTLVTTNNHCRDYER